MTIFLDLLVADLWRGGHEQHNGLVDTSGHCVHKRLDMGLLSRSAGNFGGLRYNRSSRVLSLQLSPLDLYFGILLVSVFSAAGSFPSQHCWLGLNLVELSPSAQSDFFRLWLVKRSDPNPNFC